MIARTIDSIINQQGTNRSGAVRDLLTDLLHYCDTYKIDFDDRLANARQVCLEEQTWMVKSEIKTNHYWSADKCDWVLKEMATAWSGDCMKTIDTPPFGQWERVE